MPAETSSTSAALPTSTAAAHDPAPRTTPSAAGATTTAGATGTTPTAAASQPAETGSPSSAASPAAATTAPPPDIFAVMAAHGFSLESTQDLADYLPVPPRSDGQVGRFSRAGVSVTVARVTYPDPIFADPHEQWIRERMSLLPDAHERVVRQGATVIHVRADDDATADEVMHLFEGDHAPSTDQGDDG